MARLYILLLPRQGKAEQFGQNGMRQRSQCVG